jgi:hypothetical protein
MVSIMIPALGKMLLYNISNTNTVHSTLPTSTSSSTSSWVINERFTLSVTNLYGSNIINSNNTNTTTTSNNIYTDVISPRTMPFSYGHKLILFGKYIYILYTYTYMYIHVHIVYT